MGTLFQKQVNGKEKNMPVTPWQIKFSVIYVHVLVFLIICSLTYFNIKIFVRLKQKRS